MPPYLLESFTDLLVSTQGWLFDSLVQPVLFALGLAAIVEMGFEGIELVLPRPHRAGHRLR